jgi:dTDP-N-acetylfucosamine:lipid II N-acetylfucosaminyltransferase
MLIRPFLQFLEQELPAEFAASEFCVIGGNNLACLAHERLGIVDSSPALLREHRRMLRAERVIWHFFYPPLKHLLLLALSPGLVRRITWVAWGGDLYNQFEELTADPRRIARLRLALVRRIGSRFPAVATLVPADYDYARDIFGIRGAHRQAIYRALTALPASLPPLLPRGSRPLRILLGNSATPSNLHEDALRRLAAHRGEAIEVLVPLSYGDPQYAQQVAALGRNLLGAKFVPLLEWQPPEKYTELLESVDAGVFNQKCQQALGNIYHLFASGKRVFLRSDSRMWDFFTQNVGLEVSDACAIGGMSFDELSAPTDRLRNYNGINAFLSPENMRQTWSKILNS